MQIAIKDAIKAGEYSFFLAVYIGVKIAVNAACRYKNSEHRPDKFEPARKIGSKWQIGTKYQKIRIYDKVAKYRKEYIAQNPDRNRAEYLVIYQPKRAGSSR